MKLEATDLGGEIIDIRTSHPNQPTQTFDLCGHIGRVHAHLHHHCLSLSNSLYLSLYAGEGFRVSPRIKEEFS